MDSSKKNGSLKKTNKRPHLSTEKKGPWLFRGFVGDEISYPVI